MIVGGSDDDDAFPNYGRYTRWCVRQNTNEEFIADYTYPDNPDTSIKNIMFAQTMVHPPVREAFFTHWREVHI